MDTFINFFNCEFCFIFLNNIKLGLNSARESMHVCDLFLSASTWLNWYSMFKR